jgi:hypothetical protein
MREKDGGPAFPVHEPDDALDPELCGMSLRDYFAAQALTLGGQYFHVNAATGPARVAQCCYEIADAMLQARKITKGPDR